MLRIRILMVCLILGVFLFGCSSGDSRKFVAATGQGDLMEVSFP